MATSMQEGVAMVQYYKHEQLESERAQSVAKARAEGRGVEGINLASLESQYLNAVYDLFARRIYIRAMNERGEDVAVSCFVDQIEQSNDVGVALFFLHCVVAKGDRQRLVVSAKTCIMRYD